MELSEILAAVASYVDGDATKAKEVARALRNTEDTKTIAQLLIDVGVGKRKGETRAEVEAKQAEIERLTGELDEAREAVERATKAPTEQQAEFDKRRVKLEEKAGKLEADLKAERDGRVQDRVGYAAAEPLRHLQGAVDPDYLAEVLAPRLQRKIRPAATGVEYLDEHETPYDGDERQQAKALAEDTLKAVPDKYRLRQMTPGGGSSNGGAPSGNIEKVVEQQVAQRHRFTV